MLSITVQSHLTMLQFSKIVYNSTAKLTPWKFISFTSTFSSIVSEPNIAEQKTSSSDDAFKESKEHATASIPSRHVDSVSDQNSSSKEQPTRRSIDSSIESKISSAKSVNDLLDLARVQNISNKHALSIMSGITNFINSGKIQFSDIQRDSRFIELQKISNVVRPSVKVKDNTYSSLSTSRMIEEMMAFSRDKNRDIPKLKLLSLNILEYNETLSVRQCSNILYCMTNLNFHNKMLLNKIAIDLLHNLPRHKKVMTVNYLTFSLGLLRYKHIELLNAICKWILDYRGPIAQKDINIYLCTFVGLGYFGDNVDLFIQKYVKEFDKESWESTDDLIDFVWALVVLNRANKEHLTSILNKDVTEQDLSIPKRLKLLNVNGAAQCIIKDYGGPYLDSNSSLFETELKVSRNKEPVIQAVVATLENMFSESCFATCVNTNMGFIIDIECYFDSNWKPVPFDTYTANNDGKRLAIMIHDYQDYCKGNEDLTGVIIFQNQLLEAKGYTVLDIPYQDINATDKLEKHVKYLQSRFDTFMKR